MDAVEFTLKVFSLTENLPNELASLEQEGWTGVPGIPPVATYVLMRKIAAVTAAPSEEPAAAGFAKLGIDDSKVHVYRNGRLVGEHDG